MKTFLIAAAAVLGATAVHAADISARPITKASPLSPAYNWTGFYAGVNVGYGFGDQTASFVGGDPLIRALTAGTGFGTGAPMVSAPGTAGGRGSGDGSQGSASYLVSEDNGRRVVGDVGGTAPAVFGADNESGSAAKQSEPDIALRLNLALDAGSGKN